MGHEYKVKVNIWVPVQFNHKIISNCLFEAYKTSREAIHTHITTQNRRNRI